RPDGRGRRISPLLHHSQRQGCPFPRRLTPARFATMTSDLRRCRDSVACARAAYPSALLPSWGSCGAWFPYGYDPARFDLDETNEALARLGSKTLSREADQRNAPT